MELDDETKKEMAKIVVGEDLSRLSVDEIRERINLLQSEIGRLEADMANKVSSKSAADAVFKL